jgi:integrase
MPTVKPVELPVRDSTGKPVIKADGTPKVRKRYRFVVDIGQDETGQRQQRTFTYDTEREAVTELARIMHERSRGTYVPQRDTTVNRVLDDYLKQATRDVEAGTAANYRDALLPVRTHLGKRNVQGLREQDVDGLVDWMLTSARKRGGKPGTGLSARSVSLTLGQLRAALNLAVRRQLVVRNVALDTKIPREARKAAAAKRAERKPWTAAEIQTYLRGIAEDRLHAVILLSLMGLRPAETCGLRWDAVDLKAGTLQVFVTRTLVDGEVVEKDTKSRAGERTLPLPATAIAALRDLKRRQVEERLAAGPAYVASPQVLVDEIGQPFRTDQLRRRMYKLMAAAGVRKVRPYDARHSCLTYLLASGVPDVVVSAWAGHADLSLAKRVYAHPDESHLRPAAATLDALLAHAPSV